MLLFLVPVLASIAGSDERAARGYLAVPGPSSSSLRFAPPPKQPVAALPPIAINHSPPLAVVPDFAEPPDANATEALPVPLPAPGKAKPVATEKSQTSNRSTQVQAKARTALPSEVSTEMLVKFFADTKVEAAHDLNREGVSLPFRIPLPPRPPTKAGGE